jgi:5-methylcytosine-specific restriction protein A
MVTPRISVEQRAKRLTGPVLQRLRRIYFAKHPLCAGCERKTPPRVELAVHLDHIVPLDRGGQNVWANYQGLCHECHATKTAEEAGKTYVKKHGADRSGRPLDPNHPWNKEAGGVGGGKKLFARQAGNRTVPEKP